MCRGFIIALQWELSNFPECVILSEYSKMEEDCIYEIR
jgi:hypothetical protein